MARFRIFVIGSPQPINVDLPISTIGDLHEIASRSRFLEGNMAEATSDGVFPGVLIPTSRLQLIIENN